VSCKEDLDVAEPVVVSTRCQSRRKQSASEDAKAARAAKRCWTIDTAAAAAAAEQGECEIAKGAEVQESALQEGALHLGLST
jgi:hypothetical protein